MATIKEPIGEKKKRTFWQRLIRTVKHIGIGILVFALIGGLVAISGMQDPSEKVPPKKMKYQVRVSNSIGSDFFDCERYERDGNTYVLYDSLGVKTNELFITEGYMVRISLNEEDK